MFWDGIFFFGCAHLQETKQAGDWLAALVLAFLLPNTISQCFRWLSPPYSPILSLVDSLRSVWGNQHDEAPDLFLCRAFSHRYRSQCFLPSLMYFCPYLDSARFAMLNVSFILVSLWLSLCIHSIISLEKSIFVFSAPIFLFSSKLLSVRPFCRLCLTVVMNGVGQAAFHWNAQNADATVEYFVILFVSILYSSYKLCGTNPQACGANACAQQGNCCQVLSIMSQK